MSTRPRRTRDPWALPVPPDEVPRPDQVALWMLRCLAHDDMCRQALQSDCDHAIFPYLGLRIDKRRSIAGRVSHLRPVILARIAELEAAGVDRSHLVFANVEQLGALVHLDVAGQEILALALISGLRHVLSTCLDVCIQAANGSTPRLHGILGAMLGHDASTVQAALDAGAPLSRAGLMTVSLKRGNDAGLVFEVSAFSDILTEHHDDGATLIKKLVDVSPPAELTMADFDHVLADLSLLRAYLTKALQCRMQGVNVLVWGPVGTGKTQIARVVAQELGATLYQVGVAQQAGSALGRKGRFESYMLTQALLQDRSEALVLFDEVEDAFPGMYLRLHSESPSRDKGWTNRLLEENPIPAFWITNDISQIDAAFLRRFDIIVELPIPPKRTRRQMLARHLDAVAVSEQWLDGWAADEDVAPADMARAAKVVRAIAPKESALAEQNLDRLLNSQMLVRRGPKPAVYRQGPGTYDLSCVNTDADMALLAASFRIRPHGTICMYGQPGTGKTAFAAWLAESLDKPLIHKRASDLLGMYLGQTEANIAKMFRQATSEQAVLLLDEADSFLRDRRTAQRPWEVSQVNELLVQMEAFQGIFLCATNLLDQLDPAAFRRFAVKVKFDVLTADQRVRMLLSTLRDLGIDPPANGEVLADGLAGAALGDFAVVTRRYRLLGVQPTAAELADAVRAELSFRTPARQAMGFVR